MLAANHFHPNVERRLFANENWKDIPFVSSNNVIIENVHRNTAALELWEIFGIGIGDVDIIRRRFLKDNTGTAFYAIIAYSESDTGRDFALFANRKVLYGKDLFACMASDCINNIREMEIAYEKRHQKLPKEVTVEVTAFGVKKDIILSWFSTFQVTVLRSKVHNPQISILVSMKHLSEALLVKFKYECRVLNGSVVIVIQNVANAFRDLFRGSVNRERAGILEMLSYIKMGRSIPDYYDMENLTKCRFPNCRICQLFVIKLEPTVSDCHKMPNDQSTVSDCHKTPNDQPTVSDCHETSNDQPTADDCQKTPHHESTDDCHKTPNDQPTEDNCHKTPNDQPTESDCHETSNDQPTADDLQNAKQPTNSR